MSQNSATFVAKQDLSGQESSRQVLVTGSIMEPVTKPLSPTHQKFLQTLILSISPQFMVARWLHCQGYDVYVKGLKFAPHAGAKGYSDGGDITVGQGIVDVKYLEKATFTCAEDLGFPTALAGFKPSIDKLLPDLYASVFVSGDMSHAYIIKADTQDRWTVHTNKDRVTGKPKPTYKAPLDCCRFIDLLSMPKWLEDLAAKD
jgi:hypothetical protein